MLIKRTERQARRGALAHALPGQSDAGLDRRSFLRRSGLVAGGLAALGTLPLASVRKAEAGPPAKPGAAVTIRKNICTHCSVGCTVVAEVSEGVWIGQEPGWESPINRGSHCAKGASVRELVHGDRRLKYPMKLVNGQWTKVSWETAIDEIGDKLLAIREKSGPDSVYWLGSAKFSNEGAYLFRKFAAYWGTNNVDHQARICHSTTVAGVANTWGYGAMTNSYNDIRNSKTMIIMGGNPAEAHPVSLQHLLEGKELNRANYIVIEPRLTRTAAHATEYVRIRSGTDIPVIYGMLWHIFRNGWEDKQFIEQRVYGMEDVRKEVEKWNPEEVERVSGVPGAQLERVAKMFATEKPATLIWCMGATQHTVGTANVRAFCIALLATGNVGSFGTGANIFRGHCNVQGATDLGLDIMTLPLYYGLAEGAWRHWCRVWEVDYDWLAVASHRNVPASGQDDGGGRHSVDALVRRDHAAAGAGPAEGQPQGHDRLRARRQHRHPHAEGGRGHRGARPAGGGRSASDHLGGARRAQGQHLPAADLHPVRMRRLAHRVEPLAPVGRADRQADLRIEERLRGDVSARRASSASPTRCSRTSRSTAPSRSAEDILREINRGGWSTGYCGQSPERLKAHMKNQDKFDLVTLRAPKDIPEIGGDYYGLPWPCWGTPELRHPGTHTLYNTNLHVMDGGGDVPRPLRRRA